MFVVVAYDIVDDQRRAKAAKVMEGFGDRVQRSVYECNMERPELDRMLKKLEQHLEEKEDLARIYILCGACKSSTIIRGSGTVSEDPELIIV